MKSIPDKKSNKAASKEIQKLKGALKVPTAFDYKAALAEAINEKHRSLGLELF